MQSAKMNVARVRIAQRPLGGREEPTMRADELAEGRRLFWRATLAGSEWGSGIVLTTSKGKRLVPMVSSALASPLRAPSSGVVKSGVTGQGQKEVVGAWS